jgi:hypothetical protein
LLAVIGFPHTENVAIRATRCVPDDNHSISKVAEADDSALTIVSAPILGLEVRDPERQAEHPRNRDRVRQA